MIGTFFIVFIGLFLLGAFSGLIGSYAFLRKNTLVGDAVAHAILPGVAVGFMFSGVKDPLYLLGGGLVVGLIAIRSIEFIEKNSKLTMDAAIALVTTIFFALGAVLISHISSWPNGQQSGLKEVLFGQAATMTEGDVQIILISSAIILLAVVIFYRPFMMLSFNPDFAQSAGWKMKRFNWILSLLTVLIITLGLQAVGVILMSAMLIAPAAAARYWTNSLKKMLLLAGIFGGLTSLIGGAISLSGEDMPTGPWVVMILFLLTFITLLFAPNKGYFALRAKTKENQLKMARENVLKILFALKEKGKESPSLEDVLNRRRMDTDLLQASIRSLKKDELLSFDRKIGKLALSEYGVVEAKRIVRLHRLYELYLTSRLNFKEDHIHGTAETIEHLITDELEEALLKELDFPELDPHNKKIPYN